MDAGDRATQEQLPRVCRSAILSDFRITRVTKSSIQIELNSCYFSRCICAETILLTISLKLTVGSQPNCSRAFEGSANV